MARDRGARRRRHGWRGAELIGIVLIAIGVVYLLGELGVMRVAWSLIWPVVIIAVGAVLVIGAIRPGRRAATSAEVPVEGSGRLELDLSVGAGRFRIGAGATPGRLVEVSSTYDDIATRIERVDDRAVVRLRQDMAWWPDAWRGGADWTVRLAPGVPTMLTMNAGAGEFLVDLSALAVAGARFQIGAARTSLILPRPRGTVEIRLTGGAAHFDVRVPPGVEYRLETSGGLTSVDGRTESPGFGTATDRVLVRFSGGAASVRIG
jgi:Domain of unknown function (DUF5668)